MKTPREWAEWRETSPQLPNGPGERVSGYGIMGVPFDSGHVLGLRRWTASSVGTPFTSIWRRDPDGVWTFHESTDCSIACSRWFGAGTNGSLRESLKIDWTGPTSLHIVSDTVDWTVELKATPLTRAMNRMSSLMPEWAWTSKPVLKAMGVIATAALGAGKMGLIGKTSNGQDFMANPLRIWEVADSRATVNGVDIGRPAPLPVQTALGDFTIPQKGVFAIGQVFMTAAVGTAPTPG